MEKKRKIYDFPFEKVRSQVTTALRKHENRGTIADIVGLSGLPKYQVETVLTAMAADSRGHLAVTESGEILYKFPQGFSIPSKSIYKIIINWCAKGLILFFKVWIMVMLVGYFVLFILILLIALLISIALSFARRDVDRESDGVGDFMGFLLVSRVFEFFMLVWLFSGDSDYRIQKKKKPFYKAIFEFVFGVEENSAIRDRMIRKGFIALVRKNRGSVLLDDLIIMTGLSRNDSDILINRLMLEFEGEPRVSDSGTLYFFFPELLKTTGVSSENYKLSDQELILFSRNPEKTNNWIIGINSFNILLGVYFLYFGSQGIDAIQKLGDNFSIVYQITLIFTAGICKLSIPTANNWLLLILGIVPTVYSLLFFGIPLIRRWRETIENLKIKTNNFRKKIISRIIENPIEISLDTIEPDSEKNAPGKPAERKKLKEVLLRDIAGDRVVDIKSNEPLVFSIPEIAKAKADLEKIRDNTDISKLMVGGVVFDTED